MRENVEWFYLSHRHCPLPGKEAAMRRLLVAGLAVVLVGCGKEASFNGKPVSQWRNELKSTDVQARRQAALALSEIGSKARAAAEDLGAALEDSDEQVRINA